MKDRENVTIHYRFLMQEAIFLSFLFTTGVISFHWLAADFVETQISCRWRDGLTAGENTPCNEYTLFVASYTIRNS